MVRHQKSKRARDQPETLHRHRKPGSGEVPRPRQQRRQRPTEGADASGGTSTGKEEAVELQRMRKYGQRPVAGPLRTRAGHGVRPTAIALRPPARTEIVRELGVVLLRSGELVWNVAASIESGIHHGILIGNMEQPEGVADRMPEHVAGSLWVAEAPLVASVSAIREGAFETQPDTAGVLAYSGDSTAALRKERLLVGRGVEDDRHQPEGMTIGQPAQDGGRLRRTHTGNAIRGPRELRYDAGELAAEPAFPVPGGLACDDRRTVTGSGAEVEVR